MAEGNIIQLEDLSVGYGGNTVVSHINVDFPKGKMICILGANGAGKTTMLKTISRIIPKISGEVLLNGKPLHKVKSVDLAKEMSVVLTQKIDISNLTGMQVASMGRYPHTGFFCKMTEEDIAVVERYMELCSASYLKDAYFYEMSDGEKQRIMLVRGLAQDADILMLDEPTNHLDIKHKLDVLHILRKLCLQQGKTIICTLHEPDLAVKCCDWLVLVKGDRILISDSTENVLASGQMDILYGFSAHQFNSDLGLVEFPNSPDKDVYIIGSDEGTAALLRNLNKFYLGFGIGVLHENDVIYHIASAMNAPVVSVKAFTPVTDREVELAFQQAKAYRYIAVSEAPLSALNQKNSELALRLKKEGKLPLPVAKENLPALMERLRVEKMKGNNLSGI